MREVSVTDLERAFNDLYRAFRLSAWDFIYDIDGTAEVIANAVADLVEKRLANYKILDGTEGNQN